MEVLIDVADLGLLDGFRLIDQHCHGVWPGELSRADFERGISESRHPAPAGTTAFDSQLGFAVRRWCPPVLDLPPHATPDEYLARRAELGAPEANRRLLTAAGLRAVLVDTGYRSEELTRPVELGELADAPAAEIVRLETVAEQLLAEGAGPAELVRDYPAALAAGGAVAMKSVLAYRFGLDIPPERPTTAEVVAAAQRWLRGARPTPRSRLDDPVLLRFTLWSALDVAAERGLPLQFHTGFGDPDLTLHRSDPSLLSGFIRAAQPLGVPIVLLHNYPFHRQAAYLAHVFPHVYLDVSLALAHAGARAATTLAEAIEIAPFHKLLYASDAFGLAELYYLGAVLFRRAVDAVFSPFVEYTEWSAPDAVRVARMMGAGNAARLYGFPSALELRAEPIDSPVAVGLIAGMLADLNERYGPGEFAPVDPATFASPVGAFLVAYLDGVPVGCGGVIRVDDDVAELRRMFVHPAHRRHGVGRALLGGLERAARGYGYTVLRLETGLRQADALELYRTAGYAEVPPFPPHVDDPLSVCLAKNL